MGRTDFSSFNTQRTNANRHTERGMKALEESIQKDGWIGAVTVAADGETFDGSARLEVGASTGFEDVIVVETDGTKPVVLKRVDIPTASDPRAIRLSVAANRVAELNLDWDADVLAQLAEDDGALDGLFTENEAAVLFGEPVSPDELWRGMPEFENEDVGAWKSIKVHFANEQDYQAFSHLISQTLTLNTKYIWFPYQPKENLKAYLAADES